MTTTNKGFTEPANGTLNWDTPLNANFEIVDKAFGGTGTKNVTGLSGTITLAEADYQNLIIIFTGTLSANLIYQVPSGVGGQWLLVNQTSGAYTLTFQTAAAGTSVVVPTGYAVGAFSNGTNISRENAFASALLSSPTTSGTITITGGTQSWTVVASGTNLTFAYNGVNTMRLTSSGDLSVIGNVTAYGTIA